MINSPSPVTAPIARVLGCAPEALFTSHRQLPRMVLRPIVVTRTFNRKSQDLEATGVILPAGSTLNEALDLIDPISPTYIPPALD